MDYAAIISRLNGSVWYITPSSLNTMLDILDRRIRGELLTEQEIQLRIRDTYMSRGGRDYQDGPTNLRGVGILPLYGPIFPKANMMTQMSGATSLEEFRQQFRSLMGNDNVGTILLDIDSPGGAADMIPEMAQEIREARESKKIVAVANTAANSAAYYLGSQASEFYATPSGQVGSIGTILIHTDTSKKDEMEGLKRTFISAGEYKADLHKPLTDEAKSRLQDFVDHHYAMFVNDVAEGRSTTPDDVVANYGKGDVLTPILALERGMIDGVETFDGVLSQLLQDGGTVSLTNSGSSSGPFAITNITLSDSYDADKEHSEPGTGQGGEPTPREPPEKGDKAIEGGWRRDPPPVAYETEEHVVNREWLEARANALGVSFDSTTTDEELATLVASRVDEVVVPLNQATAQAEEQQEWEQRYPTQAAQLRDLLRETNSSKAREFAQSYSSFEDQPNRGYSNVVRELIEDGHLKITDRTFSHGDLKNILDAASAKAAIVMLGEEGSSRQRDDGAVRPSGDMREIRTQFAELVRKAMTEDNMTRNAAIAHVSQQHPDLAKAYMESGLVRR